MKSRKVFNNRNHIKQGTRHSTKLPPCYVTLSDTSSKLPERYVFLSKIYVFYIKNAKKKEYLADYYTSLYTYLKQEMKCQQGNVKETKNN